MVIAVVVGDQCSSIKNNDNHNGDAKMALASSMSRSGRCRWPENAP